MLRFFVQAREFILRHERVLSPLSLISGFTVDALTLRRADLLPETLLLYSYLITIGASIFVLYLIASGVFRGKFFDLLRPWLPLVLQFTYGSIFSAFLIFYTKSASISQSWPFLLLLFGVFVGTELFRSYSARFTFQLSIFYFALFSFCIIAAPLSLGEISTRAFLIAGAASVAMFIIFSLLLYAVDRQRMAGSAQRVGMLVVAMYLLINALYFFNIIPPIPLALKDIGVYHNIVRTEGGYTLTGENYAWPSLMFSRQMMHLVEGEPVFVFSSVFAPVAIETNVVHRWEYWSDIDDAWRDAGTIAFPVVGGRDGGYRGFSFKRGVFPGLWRVSVETENEKHIGQIEFDIEFVSRVAELSTETIK